MHVEDTSLGHGEDSVNKRDKEMVFECDDNSVFRHIRLILFFRNTQVQSNGKMQM